MFEMINEGRINSGLISLAIADSAYKNALAYAKDRIQGSPYTDRRRGDVPIIEHEDVRRMLMNLKASVEGLRALVFKTAMLMDQSIFSDDENERQETSNKVALFTPVVKAYSSYLCRNLCSDAIQIVGGSGYCRDYPFEQYLRDCIAVGLYEGTNYIQALDFTTRKINMENGEIFGQTNDDIITFCRSQENTELVHEIEIIERGVFAIKDMKLRFDKYSQEGKHRLIPLNSSRFLECFAELLIGSLFLEQAVISFRKLRELESGSADAIFYKAKVMTAKYFINNILPNVFARQQVIQLEDTSALDIMEEGF